MAKYTQVTPAWLGAKDGIGWCLRQTQTTFSAPVAFPTARAAWDGQLGRHPGELPPKGVAVPIWLDHYGTYGSPPRYDNFGHAATSLPDGRVLSSPMNSSQLDATGVGNAIYPSIDALIAALGNGKYLGWSEFMNGKRVVEVAPEDTPTTTEEQDEEEMKAIYYKSGAFYEVLIFDSRSGFASRYRTRDYKYNNRLTGLGTGNFILVTKAHFDEVVKSLENVRKGR